MEQRKICYLRTNKLTGKSYIVNDKKKRISRKFEIYRTNTYGSVIKRIRADNIQDDIVYIQKKAGIVIIGNSIISLKNNTYAVWSKDNPNVCIYDGWGTLITDEFEDIEPSHYAYAEAKKHGKWGVLKEDFTWMIPPKYDLPLRFNEYGYKVSYTSEGQYKTAVITNISNKVILEVKDCTSIGFVTNKLIVAYYLGSGYSVIDIDGNTIINLKDHIRYCDGYFIVKKSKLYGLYSETGREILDCTYENIYEASEKFIAEKKVKKEILK